jgi:hypothetical protein
MMTVGRTERVAEALAGRRADIHMYRTISPADVHRRAYNYVTSLEYEVS